MKYNQNRNLQTYQNNADKRLEELKAGLVKNKKLEANLEIQFYNQGKHFSEYLPWQQKKQEVELQQKQIKVFDAIRAGEGKNGFKRYLHENDTIAENIVDKGYNYLEKKSDLKLNAKQNTIKSNASTATSSTNHSRNNSDKIASVNVGEFLKNNNPQAKTAKQEVKKVHLDLSKIPAQNQENKTKEVYSYLSKIPTKNQENNNPNPNNNPRQLTRLNPALNFGRVNS